MFGKNLKQDIYVSSGFKNWKKALNAFHKHEGTQSHKDCIVSWNSYKASALRGNVVQQIEAASADEIRQRREYMRSIVAVTCMFGKQGLPFRGHDEIRKSGNHETCIWLIQYSDVIPIYAIQWNTAISLVYHPTLLIIFFVNIVLFFVIIPSLGAEPP